MNEKYKNLVDKCSNIELLDDRVLVMPLKIRSYKQEDVVLDDEANKGKNPIKDELVTKKQEVTINYSYQKAIVLAKSFNVKDVEIGDTVIYKLSNLIEFDLIKGVSMLKRYEIIGKIKGENI